MYGLADDAEQTGVATSTNRSFFFGFSVSDAGSIAEISVSVAAFSALDMRG